MWRASPSPRLEALPRRTVPVHYRNMKRPFRRRFLFLLLAAFSISAQAEDQNAAKKKAATSGGLFETIAHLDNATFDAFNAHDVERQRLVSLRSWSFSAGR